MFSVEELIQLSLNQLSEVTQLFLNLRDDSCSTLSRYTYVLFRTNVYITVLIQCIVAELNQRYEHNHRSATEQTLLMKPSKKSKWASLSKTSPLCMQYCSTPCAYIYSFTHRSSSELKLSHLQNIKRSRLISVFNKWGIVLVCRSYSPCTREAPELQWSFISHCPLFLSLIWASLICLLTFCKCVSPRRL